MKALIWVVAFAAMTVTACSGTTEATNTTTTAPSTSPSVARTSEATASSEPVATSPEQKPAASPEPEAVGTTSTVTAPERYIVSCQIGLGPIETYWSDGSVTGYSDFCQAQHDSVLEAEAAANRPVCDGTVCRYPSGAVIPDPNAAPPTTTTRPYPTEDESFIGDCMAKSGQTREVCIQQIQEGIDAGNVRVP